MNPIKSLPACVLLVVVGCGVDGSAYPPHDSTLTVPADATRAMAKAESPARGEKTKAFRISVAEPPSSPSAAPGGSGRTAGAVQVEANAATAGPAVARKIIYDAQVDLVVESVDPIAKKMTSLVQEAQGYIAEQNVTGSPGTLRSIHWRIRIPVEQFDSFVDSIVSLGELEAQ